MTVTVYTSADASAPVLSGTIGTLITVLDACLVNGYGSQAAAGWTKAYSGTNLAAYRMDTTSPSTGMYLRVDDTGTTTARIRGYQTMSDINTGTFTFPTDVQIAGGLYLRKSAAASAVARPWMVIADNRAFYMFVFSSQTVYGATSSDDSGIFFGDIITNETTDGYECVLIGSTSTAATGATQYLGTIATSYTAAVAHYIARQYTGLGSSWPITKVRIAPTGTTAGAAMGTAVASAFPDAITGGINLFAIEVMEATSTYRGVMPGMYEPYGGTNVGNIFDTFNGAGSLAGQTFILVPVYSTSTAGRAAIRISGTWY
jgi:hypothetical protein